MTSLYIHIPFCIKKCKYCDFVSYAGCEELFDAYIECLCNEMQQYRGERIATVFIGGGTPSLSYSKPEFAMRFGLSLPGRA